MKKLLSVITALVLMVTVVSCQNGKQAAENDVKNSMELLKKGDFSSIVKDKEELEALKVFGEAYKKITYKINNSTQADKNTVLVNVTMKYPDLSEAEKVFQDKLLKEAKQLSQKSEAEVEKRSVELLKESIDERLNDSNLKYLEETFDMRYVNTNGGWEISDFGNDKFFKAISFNYSM